MYKYVLYMKKIRLYTELNRHMNQYFIKIQNMTFKVNTPQFSSEDLEMCF